MNSNSIVVDAIRTTRVYVYAVNHERIIEEQKEKDSDQPGELGRMRVCWVCRLGLALYAPRREKHSGGLWRGSQKLMMDESRKTSVFDR